jgi:hypothetical protein
MYKKYPSRNPHINYVDCVNEKIASFLKGDEEVKQQKEFCLEYKKAYFDHMK